MTDGIGRRSWLAVVTLAIGAVYLTRAAGVLPWELTIATDAVAPLLAFAYLYGRGSGVRRYY